MTIAAVLLAACSQNGQDGTEPQTPSLKVAVGAFAGETATRAAVNYATADYFTGWSGGFENLDVTFNGTTRQHTYDNGVLTSTTTAFEFPAGGSAVDVEVLWPAAAQRLDISSPDRKDQSTREAFLAEDWLIADMKGVMPTYSVSVFMKHQRAKVGFVWEGATVEELTLSDFKAYCHDGKIELMIDPAADAALFATGAQGTIKTSDAKSYTFTLDAAVTGFESGSYHEITLTL